MKNQLLNTDQYNIGYHCSTRQCEEGRGTKTAFRWIDAAGKKTDYSFNQLNEESNRIANVLTGLGITKGNRVFTFLPKMPQQFFSFLGILKMQAVAGTLFSNFGEEALVDRLGDSEACVIITKNSLLKKLLRAKPRLLHLRFILVVDLAEDKAADILSLPKLMQAASSQFTVELTTGDTPSVLHYTSGSTGKPKGVQHVHKSIVLQHQTAAEVLGLQENDIYWCTADQGWVTGTSYGIIGPWSLGVTQIHFGGTYDAVAWMRLLEEEKVNVWYTAPTALRMLMREDREVYKHVDLSRLRHIFSVGEPLNPEVNHWGTEVLGKDIFDTWFQTETGSIMIISAIEACIISEEGTLLGDGETGNLCLKAGWDSMFVNYLNHPEVYDKKFREGFYYSGDLASRDKDGYYWFVGRNDDVINTAGHLISPFEIESALLEIPEIAESAVIAAPDEILFEKVVAFIRLKDGFTWNDELAMNIRLYLSNRLSTIATPQDMQVIDEIPKNKSGKIMRRVLRAVYLGEDPGDISTLDI
jgi:acetyl-CoA synthetase